jgi:hypothetical protein
MLTSRTDGLGEVEGTAKSQRHGVVMQMRFAVQEVGARPPQRHYG